MEVEEDIWQINGDKKNINKIKKKKEMRNDK